MDFFELHQGLPREGPGSDAATRRALELLPTLPMCPAIRDIGCGPGAQTLVLANTTNGIVTAVDRHQPFLDEVRRRAQLAGCADHIRTVQASMDALPFQPRAFDIIWAEGSIFIIGFERGLVSWSPFVRSGGYVVVSELTWLVTDPPEPARRFWSEAYPAMASLEQNRATIDRCGYRVIGDFVLPQSAWFESYYDPLDTRISLLMKRYAKDSESIRFLEEERVEIDIVRRYGDAFAYVFYIAQRP